MKRNNSGVFSFIERPLVEEEKLKMSSIRYEIGSVVNHKQFSQLTTSHAISDRKRDQTRFLIFLSYLGSTSFTMLELHSRKVIINCYTGTCFLNSLSFV